MSLLSLHLRTVIITYITYIVVTLSLDKYYPVYTPGLQTSQEVDGVPHPYFQSHVEFLVEQTEVIYL